MANINKPDELKIPDIGDESLRLMVELPEPEKEKFAKLVRKMRGDIIPSPTQIVDRALTTNSMLLNSVKGQNNISEAIYTLRNDAYRLFLQEEAKFNVQIVEYIGTNLHTPKRILNSIIENNLTQGHKLSEIKDAVIHICGQYAGRIMPYIYIICQSNTQSRRARAGETFEQIIYKLYEIFNYPYDSQKKIGAKIFQDKGLGKKVDSVLPSIGAFETRRDKVIVGTMKTTLRERWQEVVEEIERTKIPKIYLLTADDDIAMNKTLEMGKHNIVLVVYKAIKNKPELRPLRNIISFETYFLDEVPNELSYWKQGGQ
jgi:EcoRII C terminal